MGSEVKVKRYQAKKSHNRKEPHPKNGSPDRANLAVEIIIKLILLLRAATDCDHGFKAAVGVGFFCWVAREPVLCHFDEAFPRSIEQRNPQEREVELKIKKGPANPRIVAPGREKIKTHASHWVLPFLQRPSPKAHRSERDDTFGERKEKQVTIKRNIPFIQYFIRTFFRTHFTRPLSARDFSRGPDSDPKSRPFLRSFFPFP